MITSMKIVVILAVVSQMLRISPVSGENATSEVTCDVCNNLQLLSSEDARARSDAAESLADTRNYVIEQLLDILHQQKPRLMEMNEKQKAEWLRAPSRGLAIYILGEYRAEQAVPLLVDNVAFEVPWVGSERGLLAGYPCAEALVKIGLPSASQIARSLSIDLSETELKIFGIIYYEIFGYTTGLAKIEEFLRGASGRRKSNAEKMIGLYSSNPLIIQE